MQGRRRAGAGSWDPSLITTRFWYRADDRVDSGGVVSQWTDRSGNARHLAQATAGARPTPVTRAGRDALLFDGGDRLVGAFGTTLAQPCTIYAVWEASALATRVLFDGDDGTNRHFFYIGASNTLRMGAPTELAGGAALADQIYASALVYNGGTSAIYGRSDFVTPGNTGNTGGAGIDGFCVGSSNSGTLFWSGYIWEIVCVPGAADAAARALMGGYLSARYSGLTVTT